MRTEHLDSKEWQQFDRDLVAVPRARGQQHITPSHGAGDLMRLMRQHGGGGRG